MKNKEIIKKIDQWQRSSCTHELTCGSDICRLALKAVEKEGKVILKCMNPSCNYEQTFIPPPVLKANIKKIEKEIKEMLMNLKKDKK